MKKNVPRRLEVDCETIFWFACMHTQGTKFAIPTQQAMKWMWNEGTNEGREEVTRNENMY